MKCLSIIQAWPFLIMEGYKDVENRSWKTNFRGRCLIHAGKKYDSDALECAEVFGVPESVIEKYKDGTERRGGIIGTVEIYDCVNKSDSIWFCGTYGFMMRKPIVFNKPMKYPGQLGFFEVPTLMIENWVNKYGSTKVAWEGMRNEKNT